MKRICVIVTMVMAVALSVAEVPSSAQDDDWPEDCQLPDLEEAMNATNAAQANGDVAAFVDSISEINQVIDSALRGCLEAAVENDVDLSAVDLLGAYLQGAWLHGAKLQRANLWDVNLEWAILPRANLQGTFLVGSNLLNSDLSGADLQGAYLWDVKLQGAFLANADLQEADLTDAIFDETTILPDAVLDRGMWVYTDWSYWTPDTDMTRFTDPEHPNFWRGYGLSGEDLRGTDFSGANLQGAVLRDSNLQEVDLRGANLQGASLHDTNLVGADLRGANLQGADLTGAMFDETTLLPDNSNWTADTDKARFTDPNHPNFWDPCVELDEPPSYCEEDE